MNEDYQKFIDYFQQRVVELYEKTDIRKIPVEPKVEWDEIEVPYTDYENYEIEVDEGIAQWVYYVAGALLIIAVFFLIKESYTTSIFMLLFGTGFYLYGNKYLRNIRIETHRKEINKTRIERRKREVPQFREEIIPGIRAVKRFGTGSLKFGVARINSIRLLTAIGLTKPLNKFNYPIIADEKKFIEEFRDLECRLKKIPFVLGGEKSTFKMDEGEDENIKVSLCGIEKEIMDHFISTEYQFSQSKKKKITSNLIEENLLRKFLVKTGDSFQTHSDDLLAIIANSEELDSTCLDWLAKWPVWNKIMEDSRFDSVNRQVIPEFIQFSHQSQYSSFNFYCPECNKEISDELLQRDYSVHNNQDLAPRRFSKNTRCHYLLETNAWQCPMCEKIVLAPIPLHKSLDEILLPVYDNLMEENKVIREQDYSDVRKKEIEFKNEMRKELERMYFDNLNGILSLKDEMEKMQAEIEGETEAINFINDSFSRYKKLQSDLINSIEESNKRIKQEIHELAKRVLMDVDRVKDREMELLNRNLTELSKAKRIEDERRDATQREILSANLEQNNILHTKFDELIDTNRTGFANVTGSIKSLEETNRQGFQNVRQGIDSLENTTRTGFENNVRASKDLQKEMRFNNAMAAATNKLMGGDPYDDSSLLRPIRAIKRGCNQFTGRLTGRSSAEIDMKDIDTLIK